jgi:cytoplasmic tRNA 2-thiolation protein 1
MKLCETCETAKAMIMRPKTGRRICLECFYTTLEEEVHYTIVSNELFKPGEKVAIGASGVMIV